MTAATVKVQALKVGDSFISKGSKLKVARIKSETDKTVVLFCMSYLFSSYITVNLVKNDDVTLF